MAEYKVQSGNNQIDTPLAENPGISFLIKSLMQGQQAGQQQANQTLSQQQAEQVAQRKQQADIAAAKQLASANGGTSAQVGEASVGAPNAAKMELAMQKTTADQAQKLQKIYGKSTAPIEDAASQVESGLVGLDAGTPSGDKTAITSLTRISDGKSARLTLGLLGTQTPHSSSGSVTDMMNYWSGKAESGLTPDQRNMLKQALMQHANRLQKELGDTQDEFKQQAPLIAPALAASGQLDQYANTFGQKAAGTFKRIQDLATAQTNPQGAMASAAAPADTQLAGAPAKGLVPALGDAVSGLKSYLFGAGTKPTPQPQPNAQPAPQAPAAPLQAAANAPNPAQQAAPAPQPAGPPPGIDLGAIQAEIDRRKKQSKPAPDEDE